MYSRAFKRIFNVYKSVSKLIPQMFYEIFPSLQQSKSKIIPQNILEIDSWEQC